MPDEPWSKSEANTPEQMVEENKKLKEKLEKYEKIAEDIVVERVFEAARSKFFTWLGMGGLIAALTGTLAFFGVREFAVDLIDKEVKKQVPTVVQDAVKKEVDKVQQEVDLHIRQAVSTSVDKQIDRFLREHQDDIVAKLREEADAGRDSVTKDRQVSSNLAPSPNAPDRRFAIDYGRKMLPVRNTGAEGSCVAFAVAAAIEFKVNNTSHEEVRISPRHIYYLARVAAHTFPEDSGSSLEKAIDALQKDGAVEERVWPYKAGEAASSPPAELSAVTKRYKIASATKLNTLDEIIQSLKMSPVLISIPTNKGFFELSHDARAIVPVPAEYPDTGEGAALALVGFDAKDQLFKFEFFHGPNWGDHGYGYLPSEYIKRYLVEAWLINI